VAAFVDQLLEFVAHDRTQGLGHTPPVFIPSRADSTLSMLRVQYAGLRTGPGGRSSVEA
jgi:hypothetical protein